MLLAKEWTIKEAPKEAPHVDIPHSEKENKEQRSFYEYDSEMNQYIAGYHKGPKISYTKELSKKYQLSGK